MSEPLKPCPLCGGNPMNVIIKDRESLQAINPLEITSYLRGQSWTLIRRVEGKYSVWETQDDDRYFEVVIRASQNNRDYALRISEALTVLQSREDRPALEIYQDLMNLDETQLATVDHANHFQNGNSWMLSTLSENSVSNHATHQIKSRMQHAAQMERATVKDSLTVRKPPKATQKAKGSIEYSNQQTEAKFKPQ